MTREQIDAIRARLDEVPRVPWSAWRLRLLNDDARTLLNEVERLNSDPLPAAAWVREVEQAAYRRGAEAMRAAAAQACEVSPIHGQKTTTARRYAEAIRALPIPEDKS
jgi:hypothetical protein